jgi:hypothetical protein
MTFEEYQRKNHCGHISYEDLERDCYEKDAEIDILKADLSYWKSIAADRVSANIENAILKDRVRSYEEKGGLDGVVVMQGEGVY